MDWRTQITAWGTVAALVSAAGLVGCGAEPRADQERPRAEESGGGGAGGPASDSPRDLETISDPFSLGLGPVCRLDAVLAGASPFPEDVDDLQAYMVLEDLELPDTPAEVRGTYFSVGLERDWAVAPDHRGWEGVNAVICVDVVPGSAYVRLDCRGPVPGGEATWRVWGSQMQVVVVDPTTAEVVAEGEPFDSDTLLPNLGCDEAPPGLAAGGRDEQADIPPGSWIAAQEVDPFVAELQREGLP